MLTPKKLETFCRWWSKQVGHEMNTGHFFSHAFYWKHKELREKEMLFAFIAFTKSGYIPEYVHEYWRTRVRSFICIKGGAE